MLRSTIGLLVFGSLLSHPLEGQTAPRECYPHSQVSELQSFVLIDREHVDASNAARERRGNAIPIDSVLRNLPRHFRLVEYTSLGDRRGRWFVESDLELSPGAETGLIRARQQGPLLGPAQLADSVPLRRIYSVPAQPDTLSFQDEGMRQDVGRWYFVVTVGPGGWLAGTWVDYNMPRSFTTPAGRIRETPQGYFCAWPQ